MIIQEIENTLYCIILMLIFLKLIFQIIANRLQDGTAQLKDILPTLGSCKVDVSQSLSRLSLSSNIQLKYCLQSLQEKYKLNIINLSAIPGCFSLEAARKIMKYRKKDIAKLQYDLQDLRYLGLLEIKRGESSNQFSEKVSVYGMPHRLRAFVVDFVKSEAGDDLKVFHKAQNRFIQFYGKKLRNNCKLLQTDACSGLLQLQQDVGNYRGFLDILKIADDFKPSKNLWWVILAIERLLSPSEAQKLYNHMSQQAKQRGDMHSFADLRCYEIMQLTNLGHDPEELLQQLTEVQDILNQTLDSSVDIRGKQFSLASCYCLRGELLTQTNKASEAIQWLQQAVSLRKEALGDGHHFLIARALRSLGIAMKTKVTDKTAAKMCFIQVRVRQITRNRPYFEKF